MHRSMAEIVCEYGPFPEVDHVHGVTFDGRNVWFASGDKLNALDPSSGKTVRSIEVSADAGTAFDGQHLFQIALDRIQKIDPKTGRVLATIPAPGGGRCSGLAWAEGTLWVGQNPRREFRSALLVRPTTASFTSPPLKKRRVGILRIPNRAERTRLLSASTLAILTFSPCSFAISSDTGAIMRHGAHQEAEKSTKIGTGELLIV